MMIARWAAAQRSASRMLGTRLAVRQSRTTVRRALVNNNNNHCFYTTERILALRSSSGREDSSRKEGEQHVVPASLYDASKETENCGVGLIASLHSTPSRKIVEQADEMLVRMEHRGGCGCDPASGDGSGTC